MFNMKRIDKSRRVIPQRFILFFIIWNLILLCGIKASPPRIGLVLSGGGAKGLAHIGVLEVLEEAGIQIDLVGGTSMGAFVGALYASGYSAAEIKGIAEDLDWQEIQEDQLSRRGISIEEKRDDGRFIGAFPIHGSRIDLPAGLITGQRLSTLLANLTWDVRYQRDFQQLPRPFLCMATDIATGEQVILDEGYLPDAIRASMAFPSVFTPIEIDDRLLMDGGLVNNFPVQEVQDSGADIIIGVDVGARLYPKDELNSVLRIIDQAMSFQMVTNTRSQQERCDVLITPDVSGFNLASFHDLDSLIERGRQAARRQLPQLRALAGESDPHRQFIPPVRTHRDSSILITELEIRGLNRVSPNLLQGKLNLTLPCRVTLRDLELAISRIYGSFFFTWVSYILEPQPDGIRLIVRVVEDTSDQFRIGFHYDDHFKSAVLLNTVFRNRWGNGSKLALEVKLSANPSVYCSYFIHTSWRPGLGLEGKVTFDQLDVYSYNEEEVTASYKYAVYGFDLSVQSVVSHAFTLGGGINRQYSILDPIIAPDDPDNLGSFGAYGFIRLDTFDRAVYPRSGLQVYAEMRTVTHILEGKRETGYRPFRRTFITASQIIPLPGSWDMFINLYSGTLQGPAPPPDQHFYFGGKIHQYQTIFPLLGYRVMEGTARNLWILQGGLQIEAWKNNYLILTGNAGQAADHYPDLFHETDLYYGGGITFGYNSVIGPMEWTLMKGDGHRAITAQLNIGYWF